MYIQDVLTHMLQSFTMKMMPTYTQVVSFFQSYGFTAENFAPLIVVAFILYVFIRRDFNSAKSRIASIEHCITELQTVLTTKWTSISFQRNLYGISNSPIILREEFRKFITDPKLDEQISEKVDTLVNLLKKKKPETGLDAQGHIDYLVFSNEIHKYLDLKDYRQNLYKKGKTDQDAIGILAVYLYEILIPRLDISDKNT